MKCEAAQNWLLQCESLQPKTWPVGLVKHLRVCASCYQFAKSIKRLEKAWRRIPVPAECETSKLNFLARLSQLEQAKLPEIEQPESLPVFESSEELPALVPIDTVPELDVAEVEPGTAETHSLDELERPDSDPEIAQPRKVESEPAEKAVPRRDRRGKETPARDSGWGGMRWLAVAAAVFMVIIGIGLLLPSRNSPGADVVDRLIEWNAELANAPAKERKRLLEEYESFNTDLKRAVLSPEERQLAETLLADGRKLATSEDALTQAEVVTSIADKLMSRAAAAADKGNEKEIERHGTRYSRFNDRALKPMWNRFATFKAFEKKGGFIKDKGIGKDKGGFDKDKSFEKDKDKGLDKEKAGYDKDKAGSDKSGAKDEDKGVAMAFGKIEFDRAAYEYWLLQKMQFEQLYMRSPEFMRPDLHKQFDGWGRKGPPFGPGFGPKGRH
ncbi:MAG TPA: anti-sigma factor [Gemmataceae bacterium]|nr:anti-sigma factor [Gemmataceae bacterium]